MSRSQEPADRVALGSVSEAQVLARITARLRGGAPADAGVLVGPGDDAAVLDTGGPGERTVLTTDSMVRGLDWRDDWSGPEDVGVKLVVQNHADLVAMGARPRALLVAFAADPGTDLDWVDRLTASLVERAAADGASLVGGDLSGAPEGTVVLAVTAVGVLTDREPVLRSGARPGDVVALAGSLGRSAAGLELLTRGVVGTGADEHPLVGYHRRPDPPLHLGLRPEAAAATAMIDLSDGLGRDGARVAGASGVALVLDPAALAVHEDALRADLGADGARRAVRTGGEEHSLLATFPPDAVPDGWQVIGEVAPTPDVADATVTVAGDPLTGGWDHFAG